VTRESPLKGLKVDQTLDVRNDARPEDYRNAKKQLDAMAEDQVLELFIGEGEPLRSIPFGLLAEGHEILVSEPYQDGVRLLVRKRSLL
jgi:TusA-related sulfurtransferase